MAKQLGYQVWSLRLLLLVARALTAPSSWRDQRPGDAACKRSLVHVPVILGLAAVIGLDAMVLTLVVLPVVAPGTLLAWRCIDVPMQRSCRGGEPIVIPGFALLNWTRKRPN